MMGSKNILVVIKSKPESQNHTKKEVTSINEVRNAVQPHPKRLIEEGRSSRNTGRSSNSNTLYCTNICKRQNLLSDSRVLMYVYSENRPIPLNIFVYAIFFSPIWWPYLRVCMATALNN